jgi:hypothetical protein
VISLGRRICPACGSRDTTRITVKERKRNRSLPTHSCGSCGNDFGGNYSDAPTFITKLYFSLGGYFGSSHVVEIDTERSGTVIKYTLYQIHSDPCGDVPETETSLISLEDKWEQFNKDLLRCYIIDWNNSYTDPGVVDGTGWSLEVTFDNGLTISRSGSNEYPPHWREFLKLFSKYGLPRIE